LKPQLRNKQKLKVEPRTFQKYHTERRILPLLSLKTIVQELATTITPGFKVLAQDYEVSDINCSFGEVSVETNSRIKQLLSAVLKRPEDFQGSPIFADDRGINPLTDSECQIRPLDEEGETYRLLINDLDKCGILVKNGFINVRVWFPKLPGVVMMSDQEIMQTS
jgi:hypothetical protein